jgi:hypothetical protein
MPKPTNYYTDSDHLLAYHIHIITKKDSLKLNDSDYKLIALSRKVKRTRTSWSRKIMNFDNIRDGGNQTGNAEDVYEQFKERYEKDSLLAIKEAASEIEPVSENARNLFIKLKLPESALRPADLNPRPSHFGVISEGDIKKAVDLIDKGKIIEGFKDGTTYDVIYNNKIYPPKLLVAVAYKIASDIEIKSSDFDGGVGTPCFQILNELGFKPELKKQKTGTSSDKTLIY